MSKIKKWIAISVAGLTLPIMYVLVWKFFSMDGVFDIGSELNKGDWLNFFGSYLGFAGTIFLGSVSLCQNYRVHKENRQLQEKLLTLDYRPILEILSYQVEKPYLFIDERSVNAYCFISEIAQQTICRYDFENDIYSAFDIELTVCNSNPKVSLKQIWFLDFLQICNFEYNIVFSVPNAAIPLSEKSKSTYYARISLVYKKEECKSDYVVNSCDVVLDSFMNYEPILQSTIILENHQGICEQCHITLNLDIHNFAVTTTSMSDITKDQIEYYPIKYLHTHFKK